MALVLDKVAEARIRVTAGKRLKKARMMAKLSLEEVAEHTGHKNLTQLSLAESGHRLLPPPTMIILCNLYGVPMDYIYGRIDDPIAEPFEVCQGVVTNIVAAAIQGCFLKFTNATAEHVAVALASQRQDKIDMIEFIKISKELHNAYATLKRLNPKYEEDARGASQLEAAIKKMATLSGVAVVRVESDRRLAKMIDVVMNADDVPRGIEQFRLSL